MNCKYCTHSDTSMLAIDVGDKQEVVCRRCLGRVVLRLHRPQQTEVKRMSNGVSTWYQRVNVYPNQ